MGKKGYDNGIGMMSAEERMTAYENGIGAMSAEEWMAAYENGIGAMPAEERTAASEKGNENGIGAMSAEERMAASEKGYENGIGAMSAEERTAASENGYKNGIGAMSAKERKAAWEKKYTEFKSYNGMPERGAPLYTWQKNQLGNTHPSCLNAKIREEIEENEGSIVWSERRVKLSDCVVQKNRKKIGNAWEKKYTEFESYDGMPERGTSLYTWQKNQLRNTHPNCLNAKIREEIEENEGSTVWSERRVKLSDCVVQKNRKERKAVWEKKYTEFESYDGMPERGPHYILGKRIS
jgi:hypothetical protein